MLRAGITAQSSTATLRFTALTSQAQLSPCTSTLLLWLPAFKRAARPLILLRFAALSCFVPALFLTPLFSQQVSMRDFMSSAIASDSQTTMSAFTSTPNAVLNGVVHAQVSHGVALFGSFSQPLLNLGVTGPSGLATVSFSATVAHLDGSSSDLQGSLAVSLRQCTSGEKYSNYIWCVLSLNAPHTQLSVLQCTVLCWPVFERNTKPRVLVVFAWHFFQCLALFPMLSLVS